MTPVIGMWVLSHIGAMMCSMLHVSLWDLPCYYDSSFHKRICGENHLDNFNHPKDIFLIVFVVIQTKLNCNVGLQVKWNLGD